MQDVQNREVELEAVQTELAEAAQHMSDLSAELEQARLHDDPCLVMSAQKQVKGVV